MYFFDRFLCDFFGSVYRTFISRRYVIGENRFVRNRKMSFKEYVDYVLVQRSCSNYSEALKYFRKNLMRDFESITRQAIGKQREFISPDLYNDLFETFIDKLYGKFKGFSKFKGYVVSAIDGSIFDLPISDKTRMEWDVGDGSGFNRDLCRARFSSCMDVNSKLILACKIENRDVSEVELAIDHLNNLNKRFNLSEMIMIYDRGYASRELMLNTMYLNSKFIIRLRKNVFKKEIERMTSDDEMVTGNIRKSLLDKIRNPEVKK